MRKQMLVKFPNPVLQYDFWKRKQNGILKIISEPLRRWAVFGVGPVDLTRKEIPDRRKKRSGRCGRRRFNAFAPTNRFIHLNNISPVPETSGAKLTGRYGWNRADRRGSIELRPPSRSNQPCPVSAKEQRA